MRHPPSGCGSLSAQLHAVMLCAAGVTQIRKILRGAGLSGAGGVQPQVVRRMAVSLSLAMPVAGKTVLQVAVRNIRQMTDFLTIAGMRGQLADVGHLGCPIPSTRCAVARVTTPRFPALPLVAVAGHTCTPHTGRKSRRGGRRSSSYV